MLKMFFLVIWDKSCVFIIIQCPNHFSIRLFCHLPIRTFPHEFMQIHYFNDLLQNEISFPNERRWKTTKIPNVNSVTAVYVLMYYAYSFLMNVFTVNNKMSRFVFLDPVKQLFWRHWLKFIFLDVSELFIDFITRRIIIMIGDSFWTVRTMFWRLECEIAMNNGWRILFLSIVILDMETLVK